MSDEHSERQGISNVMEKLNELLFRIQHIPRWYCSKEEYFEMRDDLQRCAEEFQSLRSKVRE